MRDLDSQFSEEHAASIFRMEKKVQQATGKKQSASKK
jgi:hypothetical protein